MIESYNVEFTKEELSSSITQLGARVDVLKDFQITAGKEGNIKRVLELEEFMKPLLSSIDKMQKELFK